MIGDGLVTAVHDVADGGLIVALVEMALAGDLGAELDRMTFDRPDLTAFLFGEDQGRYVVTTGNSDPVIRAMADAGIPHSFLGSVGGDSISLPGRGSMPLAELRRAHERFFPALMGGEPTVA
jgi:phosphoribosylformylglycinamidine synthase